MAESEVTWRDALGAAVELLVARWVKESAEPIAPAPEAVVRATFQRTSLPISEDIIALYSQTGGMADGVMDDNLFSLWPIEKIVKECTDSPKDILKFGDFLIDSHRYGFRFVNNDISSVWINAVSDDWDDYREIYPSLTAFFVDYARAVDEYDAFSVLHGNKS